MTLVEALRDMAMNLHRYPLRTKRGLLIKAAAEIERLQLIIDNRPAINAGLPDSYIEWSRRLYETEIISRTNDYSSN